MRLLDSLPSANVRSLRRKNTYTCSPVLLLALATIFIVSLRSILKPSLFLFALAIAASTLTTAAMAQSPYDDDLAYDTSTASQSNNNINLELISDDNLLIVDIFLGNYRLASDVFIYTSPEATIIPLQPLFDAIEFPIEVDPVAKKAHGWFLREGNQFDLNVAKQQMIVGEKTFSIDDKALILSDDIDLYADIRLLKQWLPFNVELQTSKLRIYISSSEPLPLELQLQREKKRKRNLYDEPDEDSLIIRDHYKTLGVPVIDVNLGAVLRDKENIVSAPAAAVDADLSYSVQASADLLGLQGSLALSRSSIDSETQERFTLYKRPNSPEQNMPGELGYAALGDVYGAADGLVFSGGDGLGADLQFGGVRRSSDFDKRVIQGEATPHWEVELYRNGALVDFQVVGEDARYRFEDVPVEYGENIFDIRLFGPQGQERSERESIRVGEASLPQGEFYGRASHVNLDKKVFNDDDSQQRTSIGLKDEGKSQVFVQAGVTESLSASLTVSEHQNASNSDKDNQYVDVGITTALPFASLAYNYASLLDGGSANLLSVQTRVLDTSLSYSHKHFQNFNSDRNPGNRLRDDVELRLTGNASPFKLGPFSYQLTGNYNGNQDGSYDYSLDNRVGFQVFNGRLTLDTEFRDGSFADHSLRGSARYLRVVGSKTNIRASIDYSIDPDPKATSGSASITWRPTPRLRTQLGLNGDFTDNDNNSVSLSMSYIFKSVTLSTNAFLQESGGSSILLNAEFSLSQENKSRWRFKNQSQANYGRIKARAFLDRDQDGVFTDGDQPLAGIGFKGRKDWQELQTREDGIVYLGGLRTEFPSRLELDVDTLEDPYWRSKIDKVTVVSHPGGLHSLEVPISVTVEAEGSVNIIRSGHKVPMAGLPMEIIDPQGSVVASATSEFDGFYVIEGLLDGDYHLSINPHALEKLKVSSFQPQAFSVLADDGVVYLDPILLTPDGEQNILPATQSQSATDSRIQLKTKAVEVIAEHTNAANLREKPKPTTQTKPKVINAKVIKPDLIQMKHGNSEQSLTFIPEKVKKTFDKPLLTEKTTPTDSTSQDKPDSNKEPREIVAIKKQTTIEASNTAEKPVLAKQAANKTLILWLLLVLFISGFICRFFYRKITGKP